MDIKNTSASLPTRWGNFRIIVWQAKYGSEPIALITPTLDLTKPILVRIHGECMTGDTFGSLRCDCLNQKEKSLQMINKSKNGIFIYLRQEGRGIGLFEKIKAYKLQEDGYNTFEANIALGHMPDSREYSVARRILTELGVKDLNLITNNPSKLYELKMCGFNVVKQVPLVIKSNKYNKNYLVTKRAAFKQVSNSHNHNYYFGISRVKKSSDLKDINTMVKGKINDPYLKIGIGLSADNAILTNIKEQKKLENLYKEAEFSPTVLVPILHYSFKNSKNYKRDLIHLAKTFPFIKEIQLNDIEKDYLEVLNIASKRFIVHFPIDDNSLFLLDNPQFIRRVLIKKVNILLDNSKGKGIQEPLDSYKQKITTCLNKGITRIGIAGGFGSNRLQSYLELKDYFKINFSIDAETYLHKNEELDTHKVRLYLTQLLNAINYR